MMQVKVEAWYVHAKGIEGKRGIGGKRRGKGKGGRVQQWIK